MTAQDDNNVPNLGYPADDNASQSASATPTTATPPVSPVVPDVVDAPPVAQSIDDLDPNKGQQISGPSFDTTPLSPDSTPLTTPQPSPENISGSMGDMISPTNDPVLQVPIAPDEPVKDDTQPVSVDNLESVTANDSSSDVAATSEVKTELVNETPKDTPIDSSNQEEAPVEKDKKESPLQALARKLSELKSELIEDTPKDDDVKEESKSDSPTENTSMGQTLDQPMNEPIVTPEMPVAESTDLTQQASIDGPAQPVTPLSADINSVMPSMDVATSTTPDNALNIENEVAQNTVTETVESPEVDLNTLSQEGPSQDQPATDVQTPNDIPLDPLSQFQSEQVVADQPIETPLTDETSKLGGNEEAMAETTIDTTTNIEGTEAPVIDTATVVEAPVNEGSGILDESTTAGVTTEQIEDSTQAGGKYPLNINKILDLAIERNASDVHISVGYPVMLRVDGTLIELHQQIVSPGNSEELIFPLLSDQKKELLEVNREVDLAHTHRHGGEARFRINAFYTKQNLAAALRLIPTRIKTLEELQLPAIYSQFANLKQGLILVTGPTGHGKSTTLAAILQHINMNRATHVLTIEDPIEYIFPKAKAVVDQREMHDDTHSWNVALKSALRQDPDVILVGEMRDYETIAATITLAETGHLVFATLHTNSASQTIDRIIDVFPENQQSQVRAQLSNIIEAVIAQRLLPIDGGGRRAVSEILIGNNAVRNLVREGKTHQLDNVIRTSADVGMVSLEHSLVKLVREGLITMDKAQDYAVHPEEVVRLLKS